MNTFLRGMATIGELFPPLIPYDKYPLPYSAWRDVANSFAQAGNSIWFAMKEFSE